MVLDAAQGVRAAEIEDHCRAHLGHFEVPKAIVPVAALPMTSTGKVQKFELRQAHLQHFDDNPE